MKVLLLTGSHPRHFYVVNELKKYGLISAHLIEEREEFLPQPPIDISDIDRSNFIRHFLERDEAENKHFVNLNNQLEDIPVFHTSLQDLNSVKTLNWIREQKFDLAITYGVHKIENEVLSALGEYAWNIHGGLSPWYKGNITLFWPFIMLKPNWAGMTIHKLSSRLDAGDIVHHAVPILEYGDGIHDVACKAVKAVTQDIVNILKNSDLDKIVYRKQEYNGKLWTSQDWTPQHLRFIYNLYDNDIVDQYLDGNLPITHPKLMKKNIEI